MALKREKAMHDSRDESAQDRFVPDIASLNSFAEGYKRLQDDNDHLRDELAERICTHEQAVTQLRQDSERQSADHAAALKAMDEEMHILRREKEILREGIEELQFAVVPVNDEVARLRRANGKLLRAANQDARKVRGLHDKIREFNKSFEGYKNRMRDLANED